MIAVVQVREAAVRPDESGVAVPSWQSAPPEPEPERSCTELTKAGEPCKGRPGDDGRCAAHKDA